MSSRPTSFVSLSTIKPLVRRSVLPQPGSLSIRAAAAGRSWSDEADSRAKPIIALCHLSWDWVWQRPQQFLSRLAKTHPVLFVETYCSDVSQTSVRLRSVDAHPNVTICQMHLPASRWNDGRYIDLERRRALRHVLTADLGGRFDNAILWFNDPMAVTAFAGHLRESLIVYDCMDELSQFKGAPPALIERERELLEVADIVFCGGRKMRDKRLRVNPNSHFYGTGVDCQHFGKAQSASLDIAPDIAELDGPVLGYFGVIDERIDYELVAALADANPKWHVVMVGPWAKVDPAEFPRRRNIHWLGGRPYEQLPALTKGFSVCLMPFALNEATEYINPTKALEYMAAGRPVVSTALDEVKSNFASVARIARSHEEFISLCVREVESPSQTRIRRGLKLAAENTWEAIVAKMEAHIVDALTATREEAATESTAIVPLVGKQSAYV
jgi:glycosyltransferase involved in cell wall biosynthesis